MSPNHVLYGRFDEDAPECIKDRNGEVCLGMCRVCGKAEAELDGPCVVTQVKGTGGHIYFPSEQYAAVQSFLGEREYQDKKHGPLTGAGAHTLGEWILLIEAELAEAKQALIKGGTGRDTVRHEVIQVGALCLAMLEQHGTTDPHNGRQI